MFLCCSFYFPLLIVLLPYACAGVWVCVCVRETVINSFNYPYKALYDYRDNRTHPTDLNYLDGPVIIIIIHVRVFFFSRRPFGTQFRLEIVLGSAPKLWCQVWRYFSSFLKIS